MKRSEAIIVVKDSITTMMLTMFDPEIGVEHSVTVAGGTETTNIIETFGHEPFMEAAETVAHQVIGALENAGLTFEEDGESELRCPYCNTITIPEKSTKCPGCGKRLYTRLVKKDK